jgi:hypothetical protein
MSGEGKKLKTEVITRGFYVERKQPISELC